MEQIPQQAPPPVEPPKKRFWRLVTTTFNGYLEEHPFQKAIYTWFKKEGQGVRNGWVLFFALALGFIVLAARGMHWVDDKIHVSEMSATNGIHAAETKGLNSKITQLESDKSDLTRQRDKSDLQAQNDRNALAPWMQLAKSKYSDETPSNSLEMLFQHVAAVEAREPKFELYLDRTHLTDLCTVTLSTNRQIHIRVVNIGGETATGLEIILTMPVAVTNVSCTGWRLVSGEIYLVPTGQLFPEGKSSNNLNAWRVISDSSIASFDSFGAPAFSISTNLPTLSITQAIIRDFGFGVVPHNIEDLSGSCMPAQIAVFSQNSKKQKLQFLMKYQ